MYLNLAGFNERSSVTPDQGVSDDAPLAQVSPAACVIAVRGQAADPAAGCLGVAADRTRQQLTAVSEILKRCSALISNCDATAPQILESIVS